MANYYARKSNKEQNIKISLFNSFAREIKDGPYWACASCNRLWFKYSVSYYTINDLLVNKKLTRDFIKSCCPQMISETEIGFLCTVCRRDIINGKIPKLSLHYKELVFPNIPSEIMALTQLEERFLAPRIPFMQIHAPVGHHQLSVRGRVVNVPSDVHDSIKILPRLAHETDVVAVALKKKKTFKSNYLFQTVRPKVVLNALKILKNYPAYKEAGVSIDFDRLRGSLFTSNEIQHEFDESNPNSDSSDCEADLQPWNVADNETFLVSEALIFAPGENFKPLPLFLDTHAEALSFIKLYCGQLRPIPKHLSYQNWVKSEIMRSDRRCANVVKLFYSSLKLRAQKIASSIGFCLRKTKGVSSINAKQALSADFTNRLALHDNGYKIFTPDRGSPAFWEMKKKEVFAMIRQLGPPTFFITLSAAETKWPELLVILKKVVDKQDLTEIEAIEISYEEKVRLIKEDPVTCARYFDYRLRRLVNLITNKTTFFAEYPVLDPYLRVEFQQRGSPHIHGLLWLEKAPKYKEGDNESIETCVDFIDKFITCSGEGISEDLVQYQRHKHTFTCKKKTIKGTKCRFGVPYIFP